MSFQFVGFLLTYLLHTTHAAKNGSKAGLGISLIQYGFALKGGRVGGGGGVPISDGTSPSTYTQPTDPNSHDFEGFTDDPGTAAMNAAMMDAQGTAGNNIPPERDNPAWNMTNSDWLAYALMIIGWFILIKSVSNYVRARRHEQLVLQSPERGLNVPVVAEGERAETVV